MSPRQRRFTAEEIVQILRKNGFEKVSQRGSHQKWRNKASGHQLIIPYLKRKTTSPWNAEVNYGGKRIRSLCVSMTNWK